MLVKTVLGLLLIGVLLCLFIWFKNVWTIMHERKKTVDLAAQQVNILHSLSTDVENVPLARSEEIYRQAVVLYMKEYDKPVNHLPAVVLGFHPIAENDGMLLRQMRKRC